MSVLPARLRYLVFLIEIIRKDYGMNNAWMQAGDLLGRLFIQYYRGLFFLFAGMVTGAIREVGKITKS